MESSFSTRIKQTPHYIWFLIVALVSICTELEPWAIVFVLIFVFWKVFLRIPERWLTSTMALGVFAIVYSQFGTFLGRDPATHFLSLLTAVKILEYRERRDERFLFLLGLFIIVSKFLFSIDLFVFIFQLLNLYFYLQSYLSLNTKIRFHGFLLKQMLFSLPLTIGLFVFFPRLNYNFPTFDQPSQKSGFSGFSDEMSPGDVSQIIQTDELVLRARFNNTVMSAESLYWRGEVLETNSGFSWRKNPSPHYRHQKFPVSRSVLSKDSPFGQGVSKEIVEYEAILEPHGRNWIFALDRPVDLVSDSITNERDFSGIYQYQYPLKKRLSYKGSANIESFIDIDKQTRLDKFVQNDQKYLETQNFEDLLQLDELEPSVKQFTEDLQKKIAEKSDSPFLKTSRLQRTREILKHFQENDFRYTLTPPSANDSVANFLFETKQGYCEHYSSTFVILARALNIPSRIVVGYYGGEYNTFGDFWKVTQRNAHAWSEILLENGTWLRIDPTSVIGGNSPVLAQLNLNQTRREDKFSFAQFLSDAQLNLEVINFRWTNFLLEFDLENQQEIFSLLVQYIQNIALVFGLLLVAFFLFKYFKRAILYQKNLQKIDGLYKDFSKLTGRPTHLGPIEWHENLKIKYPEIEEASSEITLAYVKNHYIAKKQIPRNLAGLRFQLEKIRDFYDSDRKNSIPFIRK